MSEIQVKITHEPQDDLPYTAEVYVDGHATQIRGYAIEKLTAIERAQEKYEASLHAEPEEWLPLYVDPVASQKA